jgi:hypothetical protein
MEEKVLFMIRWADKLYQSEGIKQTKLNKLKKIIEKGKLTFEIYCITYASNPDNLFDIMNANELLFPYYKRKDMYIIGLAESKLEAEFLVKDMLMEIYNNTGTFKVREYF